MATSMLRARQALRVIDKIERATAEGKSTQRSAATGAGSDLESTSRGLNNSLPEGASSNNTEPSQETAGDRNLGRPPSHTTVDIPELDTLDSATVSNNNF